MEETISQLPPLFLVAAYVVFWSWEALRSARQTPNTHKRGHNLAMSVLCIALAATSGIGILSISTFVASNQWGLLGLANLPLWAATLAGLALLDLADYVRHRLTHAIPILWRLHRVHHSDSAVDVTTTLRNHPIEILLRPLFIGVAIVAFGIQPLAVLLQPLLQLPVLVFQHANIRLPPRLDRMLAWLIVTPGMHLVHHSRAREQTDSNYATLVSLWDRAFGSFTPAMAPTRIGLDGYDQPRDQTVLGMLATPWRKA